MGVQAFKVQEKRRPGWLVCRFNFPFVQIPHGFVLQGPGDLLVQHGVSLRSLNSSGAQPTTESRQYRTLRLLASNHSKAHVETLITV